MGPNEKLHLGKDAYWDDRTMTPHGATTQAPAQPAQPQKEQADYDDEEDEEEEDKLHDIQVPKLSDKEANAAATSILAAINDRAKRTEIAGAHTIEDVKRKVDRLEQKMQADAQTAYKHASQEEESSVAVASENLALAQQRAALHKAAAGRLRDNEIAKGKEVADMAEKFVETQVKQSTDFAKKQ